MPSQNETRNQHYYSQGEQKLNAADPPTNKRIHSFRLLDREKLVLQSVRGNGVSIESNLSFSDLFSIHVDAKLRTNLEESFQRFEGKVQQYTAALIEVLRTKDANRLKEPLVEVFAAKLANWVRNPFAAQKVLNTFDAITDYESDDPEFQSACHALLTGDRPQRLGVCTRFNLTEDVYERWLRTLVKLHLRAGPGRPTHLELMVKAILENHYVIVTLHEYSACSGADACLLSDRSVAVYEKEGLVVFEANLRSNAFVSFAFVELAQQIPSDVLPHIAAAAVGQLRAQVQVFRDEDNLEALRLYNTRVVYQCAERVFSASPQIPTFAPGAISRP